MNPIRIFFEMLKHSTDGITVSRLLYFSDTKYSFQSCIIKSGEDEEEMDLEVLSRSGKASCRRQHLKLDFKDWYGIGVA